MSHDNHADLHHDHEGLDARELEEKLKDPEAARQHVEILAQHVKLTDQDKARLATDPRTLRERLEALHQHHEMGEEEIPDNPERLR